MPIELTKEDQTRLIGAIQAYSQENLDEEMGDLKAALFLEFCLKEIGPAVYNQAVADAQAYLQDRVIELDSVCFAPDGDHAR